MKKMGFTLVELLAVIAILAILVIIALPNVLSMFNNAKKDLFLTEAKNIYKEVSKKYISESMKGNKIDRISNSINKLDMETNNLVYNVILDSKGNIKRIQISDGTFCLSGKYSNLSELTIDNIIEGSCDDIEPKSFDKDSWSVIVNAVREGNTSKYNVGDTKEIDIGNFGKHIIRIANKSTPEECKNDNFSKTACGFVIEFQDIIGNHNMNSSGKYNGVQYDYGWNKNGYPVTSMRTYLNNDIYNSFPSDLKDAIIDTTVVSSHGSSDTNNFISIDKIYLLSTSEVWEQDSFNKIENDTAMSYTRQLDYYKNFLVTSNNYKIAKKNNTNGVFSWWLRSANSDYNDTFYVVGATGGWSSQSAYSVLGISPAFRIG